MNPWLAWALVACSICGAASVGVYVLHSGWPLFALLFIPALKSGNDEAQS